MGFFSNLFKKKSDKLTQEQVEEIDEKVELTQEKHVKDRAILSNLSKISSKAAPTTIVKNLIKKKVAVKKVARKPAKKAKKQVKKKAQRSSKKKGKKR